MADEPVVVPDPSPAAAAPVADPAAVAAPVADPNKPVADPVVAEPAKVIPDKYDFAALKLPDGVALDSALVDAVSPVFKKYGLTQEAASEIAEVHAKATAELVKTRQAEAEVKAEADFKQFMAQKVTEYQAAAKQLWGAQYDANLAIAQRGLARFADNEVKADLDETGWGNKPSFLKMFLAMGKMVSEDTPPNGGLPSNTARKVGLESLYTASAN